MTENYDEVVAQSVHTIDEGYSLLEKLLRVVEHGQIFGPPITQGEHTVITASVIRAGYGFGFGVGEGVGPAGPITDEDQGAEPFEGIEQPPRGTGDVPAAGGAGGGGGGGGASLGRPVAVITIGPEGVEVKPVIDWLKIGLAAATTLGAMFAMFRAMADTAANLRE